MPIIPDYVIITSLTEKVHNKVNVILTHITEEEEELLDKGKEIKVERGGFKFSINENNIYCYGIVDFTNGSEDCETLDSFSFLNHLKGSGIRIPSDYHYDTHECHSPLPNYRYTETWRPSTVCRYYHGALGKPERIVLFNKIV